MKDPIFILGCHKSGTSLLRSLLDGHPSLQVIPIETHFFQHIGVPIIYPLRKKYIKKPFYSSLYDLLVEYDTSENKQSDNFLKGQINRSKLDSLMDNNHDENLRDSFFKMSRIILDSTGCDYSEDKILVEKSVENFEFTDRLAHLFPNAKFLHVIRNPYANLVALRKFKGTHSYPSLKELIESIHLSFVYEKRNSIYHDNYKTIQFENLISNPKKELEGITSFLNIEWSEILLQPTSSNRPWLGNSSTGERFMGISSEPKHNWIEEITPIELKLIGNKFSSYLESFGYEKQYPKSFLLPAKKESWKMYLRNRLYILFNDN